MFMKFLWDLMLVRVASLEAVWRINLKWGRTGGGRPPRAIAVS